MSQDYKEAAKWYKLGAEQGYAEAQCYLGRLYMLGEGVPENFIESYKWMLLAVAGGCEDAYEMRDIIRKLLSYNDILEAQRLAKEFNGNLEK